MERKKESESVYVLARAACSKGTVSLVSGMVPSRFGDNFIYLSRGNCHRPTLWPDSSVVRVLSRSARGPGLESRWLGLVLFPPL